MATTKTPTKRIPAKKAQSKAKAPVADLTDAKISDAVRGLENTIAANTAELTEKINASTAELTEKINASTAELAEKINVSTAELKAEISGLKVWFVLTAAGLLVASIVVQTYLLTIWLPK